MGELERVINSVEQKTAEHWNLAQAVYEGCPKDLLERIVVGEDRYIATPEVIPADKQGILHSSSNNGYYGNTKVPFFDTFSTQELALFTKSYRLARRDNNWGQTPGATYLIVNNNFRDPTLNFDERIGLMTIMDADMVSDTDKFIPTILSELAKTIERTQKLKHESIMRKIGHTVGWAAGLAALTAASYGGYRIYDHVRYSDDRKEAAADARRKEFDGHNVTIESAPSLERSTITYVMSDPEFFAANQDLPKPDSNDTFENPRLLVIGSSDCDWLPIVVDPLDQIRVVTDAPAQAVNIDLKADGWVRICNSTASTTDSNGNYVSTLDAKIAVEVIK